MYGYSTSNNQCGFGSPSVPQQNQHHVMMNANGSPAFVAHHHGGSHPAPQGWPGELAYESNDNAGYSRLGPRPERRCSVTKFSVSAQYAVQQEYNSNARVIEQYRNQNNHQQHQRRPTEDSMSMDAMDVDMMGDDVNTELTISNQQPHHTSGHHHGGNTMRPTW